MSGIFTKTAKGRDEINSKASGLDAIVRRVLIYIDGKRSVNELSQLPRVDDIHAILHTLEQNGFIERSGARISAPPAVIKPESVRASPIFPPATIAPATANKADFIFRPQNAANSATLPMAKNFMINTLNHFLGSFAVSGLTERIEKCQDHTELRTLYEAWQESINSSRQGRNEMKNLIPKLLEII